MSNYFPPRTEAALSAWARNFTQLVVANFADYGLTTEQAMALSDAFDAFEAAYHTTQVPETRTSVAVRAKNVAKRALGRGRARCGWRSGWRRSG